MGINKNALLMACAGTLLAALPPPCTAGTQKIDAYTVIRPDGRGNGVIDEKATQAARLAGRVQTHRGNKKHPAAIYPLWESDTFYAAGSIVYYKGNDYKSLADHTDTAGANPTNTSLWLRKEPDRTQNNGIYYHGGRVMSGATQVYYIWYGNWSQNGKTQEVLRTFMNNLGGTPAWNINTTYYDSTGARVKSHLSLAGETMDNYSQGSAMNEDGWQAVVTNAIKKGRLPLNDNAVYFVLTSRDVKDTSGFDSCGRHDSFSLSNTTIKYALVGDPAINSPSGCGMNSPSPNGDSSGDAMVNMLYHELSATVTDPTFSTWYDDSGPDPDSVVIACAPVGFESSDKCLWNFGATKTDARGAIYNQSFGGRNYLLQQMWTNSNGGMCVQR